MHQIVTETTRAEIFRKNLSLNGATVVTLVALLDLAAMSGFFVLSYLKAEGAPPDAARIWKITDGLFAGSLLYLMFASGAYRASRLSNITSQLTYIMVNGLAIAAIECAVLWALDLAGRFAWPWDGPINIVSLGAMTMCLIRLGVHGLLISAAERGLIARTIAVVGAGKSGQRLLAQLREQHEPWTRVIGIFDDRKERIERSSAGALPITGTVDDLILFARDHRVDEILVALPWHAEARLLGILEQLKVIPCNVRMAPDGISLHFLDTGFSSVDGVPVYNIYRKPISEWGALLKRAEDLVFGLGIMVFALPVMLLCAIAIKLDSKGPVLFRQNRYGYNNSLISVFKFRTMYHDRSDADCDVQTTKGDPRITRVGGFLRRTSLDELPQLFNVISGEMSLVGPRPHAVAHNHMFADQIDRMFRRHNVKPGMTGWAQVNGLRGETDTFEKMQKRIEHDLYYVDNWSFFFDLKILVRTVVSKQAYSNAY